MKYIDISSYIMTSNLKILKKSPGFIIKWIEKIIWQEEMNQILTKYSDYEGVDFLNKMIEEFNIRIEIKGKENLPDNRKCFFISNHPFGIIDGLVLTKIVSDRYGALKSIGNEEFMRIPHLWPLIAAVNVFGRNPKEYLIALEEIFNSNVPITHFPAGEVSRLYAGKIQDYRWKKSYITKAISSNRNLVPFYMYGRNSYLFYFINSFRRLLGIKINIELILLPSEMFKKRNKTIKVKIGKPIPCQKFDKTFSHFEWAQKVRKHVHDLKDHSETEVYF
jgi:putative hemolysin